VFRRPDGRLVRVEIDGGVHLTLTARWRDTAKDNDAALAGVVVLRFPSVAIYTDDPVAVAQLRRALGLVSSRRC
jgi:very-short-patch-repair endonuclease